MPKISDDIIQPRMVDRDLRHPQIAEQLVEVPTVLFFASLQQQTVEHIVNILVPRGRGSSCSGGGGGLEGFLQGQNGAALFEQNVDIPVPGGSFHDLHPDPGSASLIRSIA